MDDKREPITYIELMQALTVIQLHVLGLSVERYQQELRNGYLVEYANNLGLNIPQFLQDLSRKVHIDRINQDIDRA